MSRLEPGTKPPCPFCGALPQHGHAADHRGYIDWNCGSGQHGEEPWQDQHCESQCEINGLEAKVEQLQKMVPLVRRLVEDIQHWPNSHRCTSCKVLARKLREILGAIDASTD